MRDEYYSIDLKLIKCAQEYVHWCMCKPLTAERDRAWIEYISARDGIDYQAAKNKILFGMRTDEFKNHLI